MTVEAIERSGPLTVRCACGYAFCWHCLERAHEPASCAQVRSCLFTWPDNSVTSESHCQPVFSLCHGRTQRTVLGAMFGPHIVRAMLGPKRSSLHHGQIQISSVYAMARLNLVDCAMVAPNSC